MTEVTLNWWKNMTFDADVNGFNITLDSQQG